MMERARGRRHEEESMRESTRGGVRRMREHEGESEKNEREHERESMREREAREGT